ncbi:MAG TPA: gephyrin-like molybdotransferase Glp [Acidimicrobiales bacterium]
MIPLAEARQFVLDACTPGVPRPVPIDDALGCVAAEPVVATEPIPPFVNSAMDGYALRAADTEGIRTTGAAVRLAVFGTVMAGAPLRRAIGDGEAVRIMTGAPMPAGADAVCMLEGCRVEAGGEVVVIDQPLAVGEAVRYPGDDVKVGDLAVPAGTVLGPGHLGVLANLGMTTVSVWPRPRIGVLSTGDEVTSEVGPLAPGKIRDANRHTLLALVRREGWHAVDLGIVGDDEAALAGALERGGAACDALITSGGVSVGDLDVVKVVLDKLAGGTMRWMQVAIKPAKPFAFGTLATTGTPVFGLPGNPVSAMVGFELFVRPGVRRMSSYRDLDRPTVPAFAQTDLQRRPDGKTHFVRALVTLDHAGAWHARPMTGQDSHQLRAMADANALVVLPDGTGARAGDLVDVMLVDPDRLTAGGSLGAGAPLRGAVAGVEAGLRGG